MRHDRRGLALTTASDEAVLRFDRTVERYMEYRLDTVEHLKAMLAADPEFVMGRCLEGCFGMLLGTFAARPMVERALAFCEPRAGAVTARERGHIEALRAWYAGDLLRACAAWDAIAQAWPHDLLALRLQHFAQFWMGRDQGLKASVAAALPAWSEDLPGYGYLLAMLAFGCEETGDLALAERHGRRAVELNPDDLWGVHAVAHVLEMQGRLAEGEAWLAPPADGWADRNAMRGHLWWHGTLFPLEAGRYETVLERYDRAVKPGERVFYLDLQNAASLLARLEFRGVEVGARWQELAEHCRVRVGDHAILFTDLHVLLALARAGERDAVDRQLASLDAFAARPGDYEAALVRPLVKPLAEAIVAYYTGEPARTVELLLPIRLDLQPIGGSHTQRDLFHQLLLEAALAAGRLETARALAAERVTLRPHSLHNQARHRLALERLAARGSA
jgi:tetratricopeptide (TPR) repeat protein